jgi:phage protein D/phage baseplate assembly protein gpV
VDTVTSPVSNIAPVVKIDGRPISSAALSALDELRISRRLRLPGRAVLRFTDIGYSVAAGGIFTMGTQVDISGQTGEQLFLGEVTGIEMTLDRGQPQFTVIADDLAYKCTLGTKVRTFTRVSYADVIRQIAGEHGMSVRVTGLTQQQDYLMQADSDFGFLNEIADRSGSDWWMAGRELIFQPWESDGTPVSLAVGEDLLAFSVKATALHPGATTIRGWWPKTKQSVSASGAPSRSRPSANLVGPYLDATPLQAASASVSTADMPGDQQEAQGLADRLMQRWTSGAVTAKGVSEVSPTIAPGGSVLINGAGPASGTYEVTEVEHVYNQRGFETRFTAGDRRPTGLVDVLAGETRSSFRRDGLVVGLVTMVGNSQGSAGDVKVKYTAVGDQVESNWARIVTLGAGSGRGMTFLPEVNDEVIVGFEGGDARRPIVLGGVYNGRDVPVEFGVQNNAVSKRRITSRLGHFVELGDGTDPQSQHIQLILAGNQHLVRLGKDKLDATVPAGTPVTIASGTASIQIDQAGAITLSGKKITLKSETDVEISGVNITAKASVKASVSGTMTEMKASATGEVSAGGSLALKGAMVAVN